MIAQATLDNPNLVRPPVKKAIPEISPIEGSIPPAGAGSTAALPAPPGDGISPMLPFGNGVNPVLMAPPTGPVIGDPIISTQGFSPAIPAAPGGDGNLDGTSILPGPAQPFQANPIFGGSPINPGTPPQYQAQPITAGSISDPRSSRYDSLLDDSVSALGTTDRRSMLSSLLKDFDTQQAEADDNSVTSLGRRDAALGRLGSGMTSQAIAQIGRQSARDKGIYRNQLAADTIDKEIGDRFQKTGLLSSIGNDAYGRASSDRSFRYGVSRDNEGDRRYADSTNYGRGVDARNEARGERGYQYGVDSDNESRRIAADQTNYGRGQDARNELRGERGYQDSREAYDTDRRVQERTLQESLTDSAFGRAQARLAAGRQGNPASTYAGAAGDLGGQSDATIQALMQYLQSLGIGAGSR